MQRDRRGPTATGKREASRLSQEREREAPAAADEWRRESLRRGLQRAKVRAGAPCGLLRAALVLRRSGKASARGGAAAAANARPNISCVVKMEIRKGTPRLAGWAGRLLGPKKA